jgi:hypothetical protein
MAEFSWDKKQKKPFRFGSWKGFHLCLGWRYYSLLRFATTLIKCLSASGQHQNQQAHLFEANSFSLIKNWVAVVITYFVILYNAKVGIL